jgi:hypothetical protein
MSHNIFEYIATQTDTGFIVNVNDELNDTVEIKNEDFEEFGKKINENFLTGKDIKFSEREKILFNLWQMLIMPENVVH